MDLTIFIILNEDMENNNKKKSLNLKNTCCSTDVSKIIQALVIIRIQELIPNVVL